MFRPLTALALAAPLCALLAQEAMAAPMKLICQNPRREYLVVFEPGAKTFRLNPDTDNVAYTVKSVKRSEDGLVVRGRTPGDGPAFEAFFGDAPSIVFGEDQVDLCRHV